MVVFSWSGCPFCKKAKALLDSELSDRLFADPEATAQVFGLEGNEVHALKRLDRRLLERRMSDLRSA